ncbi:MAG: dephospho-CoA kinase [Sphingobacteriales bacterium]|jgi:dephospho-CoA kinase
MFHLGLTGNMGSGKSTVAKIVELMGIPCYNSDKRAKILMSESNEIHQKLIEVFGSDTFMHGLLNTTHLSTIVFNNEAKLKKLNAIIHPEVKKDYFAWAAKQSSEIVLKESALIYETGIENELNAVIVVHAPVATLLDRVRKRDGFATVDIKARLNKQIPQEEKIKKANYLIDNSGETALIPQINSIINKIRKELI